MSPSTRTLIASLALAGAMAGCATVPTQLTEARNAWTTSSMGPAAQLTPTELYDAKKVLDKANAEFEAHGDTLEVRDYAYITIRKVELADVKARIAQDQLRITEAASAGVAVRDVQIKDTRDALAATRAQLKDERQGNDATTSQLRAEYDAQGRELAQSGAQLEAEQEARKSAEGKLAGAMKDLASIAAVREEARGLVITLSGSVLFVSGKYALLNTAMTKLSQVAEALKAQDSERRMVVEGHTDSMGSDATNQPLSLNRANAVRDYLVVRGVAAEKITAVGMGSSRPIADNGTAENRANNRRVEIVITGGPVTSR